MRRLVATLFTASLIAAGAAAGQAVAVTPVAYCGNTYSNTPHALCGGGWFNDAGWSQNYNAKTAAFTGQLTTSACTSTPGIGCYKYAILYNTSGTNRCVAQSYTPATVVCTPPSPPEYTRAQGQILNPAQYYWGNLWKERTP
jgi:hypothetical protein